MPDDKYTKQANALMSGGGSAASRVADVAAALAAVERDTVAAKDAQIEAERARHAAWTDEVRVGVEHLKTELTTARAEVAEARAAAAREIEHLKAEIHKLCPEEGCRDGMLYGPDDKAHGACEWKGHVLGGYT